MCQLTSIDYLEWSQPRLLVLAGPGRSPKPTAQFRRRREPIALSNACKKVSDPGRRALVRIGELHFGLARVHP